MATNTRHHDPDAPHSDHSPTNSSEAITTSPFANTSPITTILATLIAHKRAYFPYIAALFIAKFLDGFTTVASLTLVTHTYESRVITRRAIEITSIPVGTAAVVIAGVPILILMAAGAMLLCEHVGARYANATKDDLTTPLKAVTTPLPGVTQTRVATLPYRACVVYVRNIAPAIYLTGTLYFTYLACNNIYVAFIAPL